MVDAKALLKDLRGYVRTLEADLRDRAQYREFDAPLRSEYRAAFDAMRTAATYGSWLEERVTQSAVAWMLGTVFLRFCEDNGLLGDQRFLGGPGDAVRSASQAHAVWVSEGDGSRTDRDWIEHGFAAMSVSPVARGLFDRRHNPMYKVTPSHAAAKALIGFWRAEKEPGVPVHDFTSDDWDTRFLGDLYQDLSESARKTYALLQTPEFIEEFILDLALDPAIGEFGHVDFRCIDPVCGSGHFLLGAFKRLLAAWDEKSPGVDRTDRIAAALRSVHGVDKNPFAVAIARFRMLIAAMWEDRQATGNAELAKAPQFEINIAVGDSLLSGRGAPGQHADLFAEPDVLAVEDVDEYVQRCDILGSSSYHSVFGNPPYIASSDPRETELYRKSYPLSCRGRFPLSAPFTERFFTLAIHGGLGWNLSGFIGLMASNSFMKREFGKALAEEFLGKSVRLTTVVDSSGAYIPGHGTPTVIIAGRNEPARSDGTVRVVLGKKGEAVEPADPAQGEVWTAIRQQLPEPGSESDWVAVADVPAASLRHHPWTLTAGNTARLLETMSGGPALGEWTARIGQVGHSGADDIFLGSPDLFSGRLAVSERYLAGTASGDQVRDWRIFGQGCALVARNRHGHSNELDRYQPAMRWLWPNRSLLRERTLFVNRTFRESEREWYDWHSLVSVANGIHPRIAHPYVATHPHFSLVPENIVTLRTAPALWFSDHENEQTVLGILGLLNSSSVCFLLKQVSHSKSSIGDTRGFQSEEWEHHFEYSAANLAKLSLVDHLPALEGDELHKLGQALDACEPSAVLGRSEPPTAELDAARLQEEDIRSRMIALQEELDWQVYGLYELLDEPAEFIAMPEDVPALKLGERAFEIVLARRMATGDVSTTWFDRHGSTPVTEIPEHWPEGYKLVVEKRIEAIQAQRPISLIERPEYKRRWLHEPWEKREKAALRGWLLNRCEDRSLWFVADDFGRDQPRPLQIAALAEHLRHDPDVVSVALRYADDRIDLADVLAEMLDSEHVPYLAAHRYKASGLRKRQQWEHTWDLQREEDATGTTLDIPVPPKYTSADFAKPSYWSNRGKLDVPKERFISYPGAAADDAPGRRPKPTSLVLGWAGWDHREQAHALMTLIEERGTVDGWSIERLLPLFAGLAELLPWVKQWHSDVDPEFGLSPYEQYQGYLEEKLRAYHLTLDQLRAWRPEPPKRGRPRKVVEEDR